MVLRRTVLSLAVAAGLAAGLGGCETTVRKPTFPELTFTHLEPIRLDVGRVDVVQAYRPPDKAPNVDHLFAQPPARVAERWARQRLRAVGTGGTARVTVVDAAVKEVPLEPSGGLKGLFTTEQAERYEGGVEVRIDITSADGGRRATVSARAERARTAAENITVNDREKLWFEMTEAMMADLNASLERQMRENFGPWIR